MVGQNPSPPASAIIHDIAVVGGGLVAMAAALALGSSNFKVLWLSGPDVDVLPSAEAWDRRVYALNGASRELLKSLRLWDQITRFQAVDRMEIFADGNSHAPADLRFSAYEARAAALAWIVEHWELHRAMRAALSFERTVTHVREHATTVLTTSDVALIETRNETFQAKLVIGADGAQSLVRAQLFPGKQPHDYGDTALVGTFETSKGHGMAARQWFVDDSVVALLPLPGRAVSLVWSAPKSANDQRLASGASAVAALLDGLAGPLVGSVVPVSDLSAFPLVRLNVSRPVSVRSVLIGDAAHIVHPLAGHGLNMGFEDVTVLADVIAAREPYRDFGDPRVLDRYAARRELPVKEMVAVTDGLHRLFRFGNPLLRMGRRTGMRFVNQWSPIKATLIRRAIGQPLPST